jgi:tryptophan synthase alpha chain
MNGTARTLMTHMIPFFPDRDSSVEIARGMIDGGTSYLEVQFPFSDPTADGPTIQGAGARALAGGFTLEEGWRFVSEILPHARTAGVAVFVMSYASPVFVVGVDRFVRRAAAEGVDGLIVPDLPVDSDEGLYESGRRHSVKIVPVIALGASPGRIRLTLDTESEFIYASLRRGTTGAYTTIGEENIAFIRSLAGGTAKVLAGFGISTPEQVDAVVQHAHGAVIGSAFIRALEEEGGLAVAAKSRPYDIIRRRTEELSGRLPR